MGQIKFRQHIPGFVSGIEPLHKTVNSMKEVFEIEPVKRCETISKFGKFAYSEKDSNGVTLMALYDYQKEQSKYKTWYVVGFLEGVSEEETGLENWRDLVIMD